MNKKEIIFYSAISVMGSVYVSVTIKPTSFITIISLIIIIVNEFIVIPLELQACSARVPAALQRPLIYYTLY